MNYSNCPKIIYWGCFLKYLKTVNSTVFHNVLFYLHFFQTVITFPISYPHLVTFVCRARTQAHNTVERFLIFLIYLYSFLQYVKTLVDDIEESLTLDHLLKSCLFLTIFLIFQILSMFNIMVIGIYRIWWNKQAAMNSNYTGSLAVQAEKFIVTFALDQNQTWARFSPF